MCISIEEQYHVRLVGSLKLQVSFAKEPYTRDYILQKRPIVLRSLLIVATPTHVPLTEEIRLNIFAYPGWTVFLSTLLSDEDSRLPPRKCAWKFGDSREIMLESCGDCCENLMRFWQSYWFEVRSSPSVACT